MKIFALALLCAAPAFAQFDASTLQGKQPCTATRTTNCVSLAGTDGTLPTTGIVYNAIAVLPPTTANAGRVLRYTADTSPGACDTNGGGTSETLCRSAQDAAGNWHWVRVVEAGADGSVAIGATVLTALQCDGIVDLTSQIQAKLSATGAQHVIVASAPPYSGVCGISSTLSLGSSSQWLELAPGTTIKFLAGSTPAPMLQNAAVTPVRSLTGCSISSSINSTTLACTGGAFTSADVGRTIVVPGAWDTGVFPLTANVVTWSSATVVVLSVPAYTTVSGVTASIYNRDSHPRVSGGTWDRGTVAGVATAGHNFLFRHVDGPVVANVQQISPNGKYGISLGDVTAAVTETVFCTTVSDCIHVQGPSSNIALNNTTGITTDDTIGLSANDYPAYADVAGPISNVSINHLAATSTTSLAGIVGGTAHSTIRDISLRDLVSTGGTQWGVYLRNDIQCGGTNDVDRILIDGIKPSDGAHGVLLTATIGGTATIRNAIQTPTTDSINVVTVPDTANWVNVFVEASGFSASANTHAVLAVLVGGHVVNPVVRGGWADLTTTALGSILSNSGTVDFPKVSDSKITAASGTTSNGWFYNTASAATKVLLSNNSSNLASGALGQGCVLNFGTITDLSLVNSTMTAGNNIPYCVISSGGSAALSHYAISNSTMNGGADLLGIGSTSTLGKGQLSNVYVNGAERIADVNVAFDLTLTNITINTTLEPFYVGGSGTLTLRGAGIYNQSGHAGVARSASQVVHIINSDYPVDATILTVGNGDKAYNTNSGACGGAGPIISNGSAFKNLYSGTGC